MTVADCGEAQVHALAPPLSATAAYDGDPSMIGQARDFTAVFCHRARAAGVVVTDRRLEGVRLVVSELVTNVIRHAPGPCQLHLRLSGTMMEIAVTDTSPAQPTTLPREPSRIGQHGLEIVHALCQQVHTRRTPAGKTIHASLPLH